MLDRGVTDVFNLLHKYVGYDEKKKKKKWNTVHDHEKFNVLHRESGISSILE